MNAAHFMPVDFAQLLGTLQTRAGLLQLGAIVLVALLAWACARLLHAQLDDRHSVWTGERVIDGALFPVLAFIGLLVARGLLQRFGPTPLLDLALPLGASLAVIRVTARALHGAFPDSAGVHRLERTFSWLVWGLAVLWLTGLLPSLLTWMEEVSWRFGETDLTLRSVLEGGLTVAVVVVVMLWLAATIERRLLAGSIDNLSVRKIAANALRALLLLVGLLLALSIAGIPVGALGVLGGALGVGIGFGLQKLASNYVSGFVVLAERSVRIGDIVKVDGFEGRVSDIKTRYTMLKALNGREAIVPNELLVTSRVENATYADPKVLVRTELLLPFDADVDALFPALAQEIAATPRVVTIPAPAVFLRDFAADGLGITLTYWIADPENGAIEVRSNVNRRVLALLRARGVAIPYPQRVVHQVGDGG